MNELKKDENVVFDVDGDDDDLKLKDEHAFENLRKKLLPEIE